MTITYPFDTAQRRAPDGGDLHLLWSSEFGRSTELVVRVCAMIAAGLGVWLYNGWLIGPLWTLGYIAASAVAYHTLRPSDPDLPSVWAVGIGSYFAMAAVFVSLPLYAIVQGDMVLQFCGAMGMITLAIFNLYRVDTPAVVQPFDIALGWCTVAAAAVAYVPSQSSLAAQAVMLLLCAVVGGYYTLALISTRATRVRLRDAARRQQEQQEMEAIGRLSGGIAHDFNNILTALQGSLELYRSVPAGMEQDLLVDEARRAAARASELVSQLLAFAQRAPMETRALETGAVLADAADLYRVHLPDSIRLDTRELAAEVRVLADPGGLRAALLTLLRNAHDAVEKSGTITLAVDLVEGPARDASTAPASDTRNAHLRFSVADDGVGMSPETARRALEPFFTTKPVGKGSGLGLPMAKGFAEQSGGALSLKTSPDGTIVSLHLPIA